VIASLRAQLADATAEIERLKNALHQKVVRSSPPNSSPTGR
jgi:hypothetical protein